MKCMSIPGLPGSFMCGSRQSHQCSSCKSARATKQCDYPTKTKSGTCDRHLCERCAVSVGPEKDYCPPHQRLAQEAKTP